MKTKFKFKVMNMRGKVFCLTSIFETPDFQPIPAKMLGSLELPETPYSIGVLCHEVLHFVFHICTNSGIRKHEHSEETYTYLHQQLIEKALEKISKFANTKKIEDGKSS